MKIYVASSWRNTRQPEVVAALRALGHEVYDFRNPPHGNGGFHWSDIDEDWKQWTPEQFCDALDHDLAVDRFDHDFEGMKWADICVMVMPCGRSAHLEAGWFLGQGKFTHILLSDGEPELMYAMATCIHTSLDALLMDIGEAESKQLSEGMLTPEYDHLVEGEVTNAN